MSIPPLVCSTPPPPDQCEDDKDPEDFDLHYNLSQEEDYDYGSFSTYNHFQSTISENKQNESPINKITNNNVNNSHGTELNRESKDNEILQWPNAETEVEIDQSDQEPAINTKLNNEENLSIKKQIKNEDDLNVDTRLDSNNRTHINEKLNNEEELNVEDLNLTVEEEDSVSPNVKNELDSDTDSNQFNSSDKGKVSDIPNMMTSSADVDTNDTGSNVDDITIGTSSIDNTEELPDLMEDQKLDHNDGSDNADIKNEHEPGPNLDKSDSLVTHVVDSSNSVEEGNEVNNETDDEFGDFNDFHVTSVNKLSTVVDFCENPWDNNPPKSDFGTFEAHFDDAETMEPPLFESSKEKSISDIENKHDNVADDDDFGDFDDFKSSTPETEGKEVIQDPLSRVPVLDFQSSDNEGQVVENVSKIVNALFEEDIPEPESVFECQLESLLCETWGHLLETDVRQPYIVNWNSSFGQKTLLKALCIDSRNILFGPKWHYNMPKYAANLSAAPLQPQKQSTPSGTMPSESNSDKNTPKASSTWADPFTSDGQEFTYAEALLLDLEHLMATLDQMAHNHSNLKISELLSHACNKENNDDAQKRPTDLACPALASEPDQIFSSTLNVQPIRQINLPDTHIFTPTDSETPRSKTIHYNIPPVFLSQSSTENDKKTTETAPSEFSSTEDSKSLDDGDYSDFQDFKGSIDINTTNEKPASVGTHLDSVELPVHSQQIPSTSVTYSIGILQPIKIEPTMPTLNWPSPGEVKETFDDFSEFASNTTWNNASPEIQTQSFDVDKNQFPTITPVRLDSINTTKNEGPNNEDTLRINNDSFDDEFDTFQSALPIKAPNPMVPINNLGNFEASNFTQNLSSKSFPDQGADFDFVFPKIDIVKSDAISRPNDIHRHSELMHQTTLVENIPIVKESIAKIPAARISRTQPLATNVLQPIVNPPSTQSNTAQILQPLSLESISQINWPNPGINLQDLSSFNPVETLNSLKSDLSVSGNSKGASPVYSQKTSVQSQLPEEDIWGEFVSSKPKPQQSVPKNTTTFVDDDEWTDFVSSPTVKPQNGLNTISLNVHTNSNTQKPTKQNKLTNQALEIPTLNIITPKSSNHSSYNDRHFQNL